MGGPRYDWSDLAVLYVDEKLSTTQIGHLKGCESSTVSQALRRAGIPARLAGKGIDWSNLRDLYVNQRLSTVEIANMKGCTNSSVGLALKASDILSRGRSEAAKLVKGRLPHKKVKNKAGYVMVWMPGHPGSNSGGYIFEHRLIMEQHLNRPLLSTEFVHHKNGVKDDNRLANLELTSNGAHSKAHSRGYRDGYRQGYQDGTSAQIEDLRKELRLLQWQIKELRNEQFDQIKRAKRE